MKRIINFILTLGIIYIAIFDLNLYLKLFLLVPILVLLRVLNYIEGLDNGVDVGRRVWTTKYLQERYIK